MVTNRKHCRPCQREYQRSHYRLNAALVKANVKARRRRAKSVCVGYVNDYLRYHPCVDCGETDIEVLQFDHVRGTKVNAVCAMIHNGSNLTAVVREIAKCEVRCANDHIRVTRRRRGDVSRWRTSA